MVQGAVGGVTTSVFNADNRLSSRQFGGTAQVPLRIDFTYNGTKQLATATRYADDSGLVQVGSTSYSYDSVNRLNHLRHFDALGNSLANYTYVYDGGGRLTSETYNGTTTTYSYDTTNQLQGDGSSTFSYDGTGNRTNAGYTTGTGNQLTSDGTWNYSYDNEGNVTQKTNISTGYYWKYTFDLWNHLTEADYYSNTSVLQVSAA